MNAGALHEIETTFGQRSVSHFTHAMQRRELVAEILEQVLLGLDRDLSLREEKPDRRQRDDNQRHRDEQLRAEAAHARFLRLGRGLHGKSARTVDPLFTSIARSCVVLLSIHALSVCLPGGRPLSL